MFVHGPWVTAVTAGSVKGQVAIAWERARARALLSVRFVSNASASLCRASGLHVSLSACFLSYADDHLYKLYYDGDLED